MTPDSRAEFRSPPNAIVCINHTHTRRKTGDCQQAAGPECVFVNLCRFLVEPVFLGLGFSSYTLVPPPFSPVAFDFGSPSLSFIRGQSTCLRGKRYKVPLCVCGGGGWGDGGGRFGGQVPLFNNAMKPPRNLNNLSICLFGVAVAPVGFCSSSLATPTCPCPCR